MEIIILIVLICFIFCLANKKIRNSWIFHLIVNMLFYGSYFMLWKESGQPQINEKNVDKGLGVAFFIFFTTPIFILFNLFFTFYSFKRKLKLISIINIIGFLLCMLNLAYLYYKTNGFS